MSLERSLNEDLTQWKGDPLRRPLLLRGARQVGKSFLVREFARASFRQFVEVNFELHPELKAAFDRLDPASIVRTLGLVLNVSIEPGHTVLFLDEIQECPKAILSLRYFHEHMPSLHVIGAGSLLDFALDAENFRAPVGRIQYLHLRPLSFSEFLAALEERPLLDALNSLALDAALPEPAHEKLLRLVRDYLLVGGMPGVVSAYLASRHATDYQRVATALLQTLRDDFGKYASRVKHPHMQKVLATAPKLVGQRYKFVLVDRDVRARELRDALSLLVRAGLVHMIQGTSGAGLPLAALGTDTVFKILFLDVGLMQRALGLDAALATTTDFFAINSGAVAEQFVGQELIAYSPAYDDAALFYWSRDKGQAEVDYVCGIDGRVVPIEVKAGRTGRLRSLKQFMLDYRVDLGVRFSQQPLSLIDGILSVPLYAVAQLPRLIADARARPERTR